MDNIVASPHGAVMDQSLITTLLPSTDPLFLLAVSGIFLVAGAIKGFLGLGLPAAAMALLTLLLPPTEAIALIWLPMILSNIVQFGRASEKVRIARRYIWFAAALFVTVLVTSSFITSFPTALLTIIVGTAMILFSLHQLSGWSLPIGAGRGWQIGLGMIAGVLGGLSAIWSPPVAMYLLARNIPKDQFVGAAGYLFLAGCIPLGGGLFLSGLITPAVIMKSLLGLVTVLIGFRIGEAMRGKISHDLFRRIVLLAFLIMGGRLLALSVL